MTKCAITGSFDPFTTGHMWLVSEALRMFDEVVVLMAINPSKDYMFTQDQRLEIVRRSVDDFIRGKDRIHVDFTSEDVGMYCKDHDIPQILRGARTSSDFEYEKGMTNYNMRIYDIRTIILTPPSSLVDISSSVVRTHITTQNPAWAYFVSPTAAKYITGIIEGGIMDRPEKPTGNVFIMYGRDMHSHRDPKPNHTEHRWTYQEGVEDRILADTMYVVVAEYNSWNHEGGLTGDSIGESFKVNYVAPAPDYIVDKLDTIRKIQDEVDAYKVSFKLGINHE